VRAIENSVFVVAANQGASMARYPPFSWPGGSMLVDYDGRILAQADPGPGEKVVVAGLDLSALRAQRSRRRGHDMRGQLRSQAYDYLSREWLPPAAGHPLTPESIDARITEAKKRLD
jgi:predicted amidohydrolase